MTSAQSATSPEARLKPAGIELPPAQLNSAPGFTRQPFVINGASDVLVEIFGDAGRHARSALGANELRFDIPVEIEMIVEVAPRP